MLTRAAIIIFVLASLRRVSSKFPPTQQYPYQQELDHGGHATLYWNYDDTYITMELHVKSTGWIGLGISPTGTMKGADIYVGWVKDGKGIITDRHGVGNEFPPLDKVQNVELLLAKEGEGGWTVLKFRRTIDTCIDDDLQITRTTMQFIYAWAKEDPVGNELKPSDKHTFKGKRDINLLGHLNVEKTAFPPGEQHQKFRVTSGGVTLPPQETFYFCRLVPMPDVSEKHHIVRIEAVIQSGNEALVHHMVINQCAHPLPAGALVNQSGECYSSTAPIDHANCVQPLFVWDQGNAANQFPTEVGFPFGEAGDPKYLLLEIHFDNHEKHAGIVDDSGLLITYTSELRKYDAGMFSTGHLISELTMIIPPGAPSFPIGGYCSQKCITDAMEDSNVEELRVIAVMSHTHSLGQNITLRHYRGDQELLYLTNQLADDFNDHLHYLDADIVIRKGDRLRTFCEYNSMDRKNFTFGGMSTNDEMCLVYAFYYPRTNLAVCKTEPTIASMTDIVSDYGVNYRFMSPHPTAVDDPSWEKIVDTSVNKTVDQILNEQTWNETMISMLNEKLSSSRVMHICSTGSSNKETFMDAPVVTNPYVPPPKVCNVTINVTLPGEAPRLVAYPGFILIHLAIIYFVM